MPLDNLINSSASPRQGWSGHSRAVQLPAGMCLLIGRKPPVRAHYQPGGTVTDVIEGTAGAEGQNTGHTSGEGIPADPARNNGNSSLGWALDDLLTEEPGPAPQASAPVAHESWWDAPHRSASRTDLRPVASAAQTTASRPSPGPASSAPVLGAPGVGAPGVGAPGGAATAFASAAGSSPVATLEAPPLDGPRTDGPRLHDTMPFVAAPPAKARRKAKAKAQDPAPPQMVVNGLVLPTPPEDEEKYRYVRRYAWLITFLGGASFPLLVFSQVRMMLLYHWF